MSPVNALPTQTTTPLALKDIHLPEQVSNFPIAYGWWLLAALIIIAVTLMVIKITSAAKLNKVKKQALAQLNKQENLSSNDIMSVLKWAAMHYFSRTELAKLYGQSLQQFLMLKLPATKQQRFAELSEYAFANQYQANTELQTDEKLQQAATLWLTYALPPRPLKKAEMKSSTNNEKNYQGVKP